MSCPTVNTYTEDGWIVTETIQHVAKSQLDQYGGVGADTGWTGNADIKQYRIVVGKLPSEEVDCCVEKISSSSSS